MLSLRAVPLSSSPSHYRCVGCTAALAQPETARSAGFNSPRLARSVHRRQRRVVGFLSLSASAPTDSDLDAQSNALLLKYRSLALGPSRVQVALQFHSSSGLTLPSSGPAFGGPLIELYVFHDNRWRTRALSDQVLDRRIGAWPRWTKPLAGGCAQGG